MTRKARLITGSIGLTVLVILGIYIQDRRAPLPAIHSNSTVQTKAPAPPSYEAFPEGHAAWWIKQDAGKITKVMYVWVNPTGDPGGCTANRRLESAIGDFEADMNIRRMPNTLASVSKELRDGIKKMRIGTHLRDHFCEAPDPNMSQATTKRLMHGFSLVKAGFNQLQEACSALDKIVVAKASHSPPAS